MQAEKATRKNKSQQIARDVFEAEAKALLAIKDSLGASFDQAVDLVAETIDKQSGRVVVTGMGKSGHIGAKIAATLASTGTPSFFVHPAEMGHGDLGMLTSDDVVIGISFSGNTDELRKVLAPIKRLGVPLISITGNADSLLAEFSDVILLTPIDKEACPLDLAPTSSTTAALVMGDALAIALMDKMDFKAQDFAKSHPLGSLGKSLVRVSEVMRSDKQIPSVEQNADLNTVLEEIDAKKLGFTTVLNDAKRLLGVITDGDIRRAQLKFGQEIVNKQAQDLMSANPKTIKASSIAISALKIMEEYRISDLVVVDDSELAVGVVDLKDFLVAGLL